MANIKNSNVFFKSGSQANYDALTSRDAGTFYVTHDTHRLYLGNDLLSQAVEIVTSLPDKSDARVASGTIFYLEGKNILAIFDKTANDWVQLNPDTSIEAITFDTQTNGGVTELNLIVKENRSTKHNGGINGTKSFSKKIKFSGARGITVTPNAGGDGLIITAPELTVGAATGGAKIGLDTKEVPIVGEGSTAVSYDSESGKIKISSSYENTKITGGDVNITPANTDGIGFDVAVQLQAKTNDSNPETIVLGTGKLNPGIQVVTGRGAEGLTYSQEAKFNNGVAKLDTYSTSYLDKKFQDTLNQVNSMTYKGKLEVTGGIATLPNSGVHIGDTYILPEAAQVNGSSEFYQPGTLFIAKGTEGADGIIGSDLSFDSVLTSDSDTTYTLTSDTDGTLSFRASTSKGEDQSTIEIAGDDYVNATITHESGNTAHATISVSHKSYSVEKTKDASAAVTQVKNNTTDLEVVDRIECDNGHITKVITKDVKLLDTVTKLSEASFTVPTTEDKHVATINLAVKDDQGGEVGSEFKIASNTLTLSADPVVENAIRAELVWGSFDE